MDVLTNQGTHREILEQLGHLSAGGSMELTDLGWSSWVYHLEGGTSVAKFPRSAETAERYSREATLNLLLAEYDMGVTLPRLLLYEAEYPLLIYEGISAQPLDLQLRGMTLSQKRYLGERLGAFLRRLHALPFPPSLSTRKIQGNPSGLSDLLQRHEQFYRASLGSCLDSLTALLLEDLPTLLERRSERFAPVFCHGDLGLWNVLWQEDCSLVAVVDFADAGLRDASTDFCGLWDTDMREATLEAYGSDDPDLPELARLQALSLLVTNLPALHEREDRALCEWTAERIRSLGGRG